MSDMIENSSSAFPDVGTLLAEVAERQDRIASQQRETLEAIGQLRVGTLRDAGSAAFLGRFHELLFGRPIDPHPDYAGLGDEPDTRAALVRMMNSFHFRWCIREAVPVWGAEKWVCTDFQGLRMWVNLSDAWLGWVPLTDVWEDKGMAFVLSHLGEGSTFLDVGVNVGPFTLRAARHVGPRGHVFGFEPRPDTAAMAARSIADNGFDDRVTLFRHAVGDASGTMYIHLDNPTNPGSSHVRSAYVDERSVATEVVRLDDVDFGGRRVDFMKMDIEGYEANAIAGGRRFLAEHRPVCLTEFCPAMLREIGGTTPSAYVAMWNELGFTIRLFDEHGAGLGRELSPEAAAEEHGYPPLTSIVAFPDVGPPA